MMVLLYTWSILLASCSFEDEPGVCPQNLRLEYWYAGNGSVNNLSLHMDRLQEFLYDSNGTLLRTRTLRGDSLTGKREILPPGQYKVVVWGNYLPERQGASLEVRTDVLQTAKLSAARDTVPSGYRENTEKLYYGSGTFTVSADGTVASRVYVSHAHASLKITVNWQTDRPLINGPLIMRLRGIPNQYGFIMGREIGSSRGGASVYQIPTIGVGETQHAVRASVDYSGDVIGQFITYRYTSNTHPLWSLYCGDRQLVKELDLWRYFQKSSVDLDHNIEQEFHLLVIVEPDQIVVREVSGADWDEGGTIG